MSFSRWKMMAGVLGVSLGGLAAAASQCPKLDMSKGRSSEPPVAKADPKLPPAGAPTAPAFPDVPAPPIFAPNVVTTPAPSAPVLPLPSPDTTTKAISSLPPLPPDSPVIPTGATLPPLPDTPNAPTSAKTSDTKSVVPLPPPAAAPTPSGLPLPPPASGAMPPLAPKSEPLPPSTDPFVTLPGSAGTAPAKQPVPQPETRPLIAPVVGSSAAGNPPSTGALPHSEPVPAEVPLSKPTFAPPASAPVAAVADPKFRIILRVGEGEPTFEVKNGDNLVLKVACEKVDIESVEKGTGLSKVTARGKVRFVGFGAEGSCEALSFIAGTGEVQMNGEVKVQVKDKLGRVESELTTAAMKYKIDASSVGGTLKP